MTNNPGGHHDCCRNIESAFSWCKRLYDFRSRFGGWSWGGLWIEIKLTIVVSIAPPITLTSIDLNDTVGEINDDITEETKDVLRNDQGDAGINWLAVLKVFVSDMTIHMFYILLASFGFQSKSLLYEVRFSISTRFIDIKIFAAFLWENWIATTLMFNF